MPEIQSEVRAMMGLEPLPGMEAPAQNDSAAFEFGANDVTSLSWKNLLQAYSCTECGRCTAACPANQTGKKLSPRKVMMDVRDRAEEVGLEVRSGRQKTDEYNDGKSLFDRITPEEIHACTTCNACVEACPVLIDPLSIILELRRYISMEESGSPAAWNAMFQNIETNFAPWKFAPTDRFNWAEDLKKI